MQCHQMLHKQKVFLKKKTYRAPLELEQLYIARVPKKLASASFEAMPWFQKTHRKYISIRKPALPKSSKKTPADLQA